MMHVLWRRNVRKQHAGPIGGEGGACRPVGVEGAWGNWMGTRGRRAQGCDRAEAPASISDPVLLTVAIYALLHGT